jgi:hypothetical protein
MSHFSKDVAPSPEAAVPCPFAAASRPTFRGGSGGEPASLARWLCGYRLPVDPASNTGDTYRPRTAIGEITAAFATLVCERVDALYVNGDAFFTSRRVQLATLAARDRIPAIYTLLLLRHELAERLY